MFEVYQDYAYLQRREVSSWDAAEVVGKDGLVQHGKVIGAERDGLIIDFGCAGQRRRSLWYGQAFSYRGDADLDEMPVDGAVEVLLRDGPQCPWLWRPATLLSANMPPMDTGLAVVEMIWGGCSRRQLVPYSQIRTRQSRADLKERVILSGDFAVQSVCLPSDHAKLLSANPPLWKVSCHELCSYYGYRVLPVSLSGQELVLLQHSDDYHRGVHQLIDAVGRVLDARNHVMDNGAVLMGNGWHCCLPLTGGSIKNDAEGAQLILQHLPKHVLYEVLEYVDTKERALQRRVSRVFDALICTTLSVDIRLTHRQCRLDRSWSSGCSCRYRLENYPFATTLLKSVTSRTRRITLTDAGPHILADVLYLLGFCVELGLCTADQQVVVVAFRSDIVSTYFGYDYGENVDILALYYAASCCQKLLVEDCTMDQMLFMRSGGGSGLAGLRFSGTLRRISVKEDMYRLVESQLPAFDVQRVIEWVAESVKQSGNRSLIAAELNDCTRLDTRPDNAYTGHEWTADNLAGVDVAKLSRLTQYSLSRYVPSPNLTLPATDGM